jgi:hypothetical protein
MKKVMYQLEEVIDLINQNKKLLLAGDEELLKKVAWTATGSGVPYHISWLKMAV